MRDLDVARVEVELAADQERVDVVLVLVLELHQGEPLAQDVDRERAALRRRERDVVRRAARSRSRSSRPGPRGRAAPARSRRCPRHPPARVSTCCSLPYQRCVRSEASTGTRGRSARTRSAAPCRRRGQRPGWSAWRPGLRRPPGRGCRSRTSCGRTCRRPTRAAPRGSTSPGAADAAGASASPPPAARPATTRADSVRRILMVSSYGRGFAATPLRAPRGHRSDALHPLPEHPGTGCTSAATAGRRRALRRPVSRRRRRPPSTTNARAIHGEIPATTARRPSRRRARSRRPHGRSVSRLAERGAIHRPQTVDRDAPERHDQQEPTSSWSSPAASRPRPGVRASPARRRTRERPRAPTRGCTSGRVIAPRVRTCGSPSGVEHRASGQSSRAGPQAAAAVAARWSRPCTATSGRVSSTTAQQPSTIS